jgi:hypothetical protein
LFAKGIDFKSIGPNLWISLAHKTPSYDTKMLPKAQTNNSSLLYCKFSNQKFKICFLLKVINIFLLLIQSVLLQSDHKDERVGEAGRDGGQERCGQNARVLTGFFSLYLFFNRKSIGGFYSNIITLITLQNN